MRRISERSILVWSFTLTAFFVLLGGATNAQAPSRSKAPSRKTSGKLSPHSSLGGVALHFEENRGQTGSQVQYMARGAGYTVFLTPQEAIFALRSGHSGSPASAKRKAAGFVRAGRDESEKISVLRMKLAGGNASPVALPSDKLPGVVNYLVGRDSRKWRAAIPTYSKVRYLDVYSGIDMVYYGRQNQLEYDFVVNPGADPKKIAFSFEGATALAMAGTGEVNLDSAAGRLTAQKPSIYQIDGGKRKPVSGNFALRDAHTIGVDVKDYDRSKPLIIDPVITFSSFLGGTGEDAASGIAVDSQGNSYVTGSTTSIDFLTTGTSLSAAPTATTIGFVSKLDPTGSTLLYSTYLGGSTGDFPSGIAVDGNGQAYVTGSTRSSNFPVTAATAFQTAPGSGASFNAFLAKLAADGQSLSYSTYLGGTLDDEASGVAVDASGNAYLSGYASSANFPVTPSTAFQFALNSLNGNAFVARIDTTKSGAASLVYSTFLGGSSPSSLSSLNSGSFGGDAALHVAVDANQNVYLVGEASSTDFPITAAKAYQTSGNGQNAVFLARLDTNQSGANSLVYSTFLGGTGTSGDLGYGIALDSSANAYITGCAFSLDFPVTVAGANSAAGKAFVAKFNTNLSGASSLGYSTLLGGSGGDCGSAIVVDPDGDAYVGGFTFSSDFPVTANALQSTLQSGSASSGFVATLNPDGTSLLYASYLGGSGSTTGDFVTALAIDPHDNLYIAGQTDSANFPTSSGAFQTGLNGPSDAFVTQISAIVPTPQISSVFPTLGGIGSTVTLTGSAFGNSQGQSMVKFNGIVAPITNWSAGTITARVPSGLNPGTATVIVNGNLSSSNGVQFTVTDPLFANPNQATMLVGDTRAMQLLDENGALLSNATWTFDDSSIAEIVPPANPGDPTMLKADAVGTTTFIASSGNRTGTGKLTVLAAGSSFPIGAVQWSIPSLGGSGAFGITRTVQSLRIDENTPDLYAQDDGALGGFGSIRALTSDGSHKWIWPATASSSNPTPVLLAGDDQGGAVYQALSNIDSSSYLGRVDENGNESWRYSLGLPQFPLLYAIHPDGTIFFVDQVGSNGQGFTDVITAVDPATGGAKFTIPIPGVSQVQYVDSAPSVYPQTCLGGRCCVPGASDIASRQAHHGPLSISSDGAVYVPLFTQSTVLKADSCIPPGSGSPNPLPAVNQTNSSWTDSSTTSVMVIQSDGTYSVQSVDQLSNSGTNWGLTGEYNPLNGHAVPDGQGGVFLTQAAIQGTDPGTGQPIASLSSPPQLYHFASSGTSKFPLPSDLAASPQGDDDALLLGEDGTAYIRGRASAGNNNLMAIATVGQSAGQVMWTSITGRSPRLSTVLSDGSVVFQSMQSDNAMHLSIADPNGNITPLFANPADGSDLGPAIPNPFSFPPDFLQLNNDYYWTLGTWHASLSDGGLAAVSGSNLFVAASERPVSGGSEKKDGKPRVPKIANYLPSQIEAQPSSLLSTANYPCFMDAAIWNARRDYSSSPCNQNFVVTQDQTHKASQKHRIRRTATVQQFRTDLDEPLEAMAFIGHSVIFDPDPQHPDSSKEFSIGVNFYYPVNGQNAGDESSWDVSYVNPDGSTSPLVPECLAPQNFCTFTPPNSPPQPINKLLPFEKDSSTVVGLSSVWNYANDSVTRALTPGPPHAPILLANKIAQQAKILFLGACALSPQLAQGNDVPVFLQMWDINDARYGVPETRDRAIVVPDGNSVPGGFNTNSTDLAFAAAMWQKIVYDLVVRKMNIQEAVNEANSSIAANWPPSNGVRQPNFMVLGNKRVRIVK